MSIAGGLHLAFERAAEVGCDCLQIFVKNQRQWRAPELTDDQLAAWHEAKNASPIAPVVAHATYLINLANPDDDAWHKSMNAFAEELLRCGRLEIGGLVVHPGSHLGEGESAGLKRVADALDIIHEHIGPLAVKTVLETTAGQGTNLGHRFEHLSEIIDRVREPQRLAVCVDTCHVFAAGYDLQTAQGYEQTIAQLDTAVGLDRVVVFHLNDSLKPQSSRRDRHAAIGKGEIGRDAFKHLINDSRFFNRPMILETPKGKNERNQDLDRVNLATLRQMIAK